ncbi:MAG: M23 family metallopeptidase [Myxococcales bacterium]|nr:M23 family metallopeptidase [Myxococcales bacterium]
MMKSRSRIRRSGAGATAMLVAIAIARLAAAGEFTHLPPGDLIEGSGEGRVDDHVYAPAIRFPIESAPAYANSQVYNPGGYLGPAGGQCDASNYDYPWRDNYCETRQWDMPLCPAGTGHQGQDIRAATCEKELHFTAAATDGTITSIGSYSVYLTAADGTRYDYLHMGTVEVGVGEKVKRGQHLGRVSNEFGGTPTSIHLHFNIRQFVAGVGSVYVPPYTSLVAAYESLVDARPYGAVEVIDCARLRGHAYDVDTPDLALDVEITTNGDPRATLRADEPREDLCEAAGSCDHGFEAPSPYSLFDGATHALGVSAIDPVDGTRYELLESPAALDCGPLKLSGARRPIDEFTEKAWGFVPFWDELPPDDAALRALAFGHPLDDAPRLVAVDGDVTGPWLIDGSKRRKVAPSAAKAWRFAPGLTQSIAAAELEAIPEGAPWPARPMLVRLSNGDAYALDAASEALDSGSSDGSDPKHDGDSTGCACTSPAGTRSAPFQATLALAACLMAGLARRLRRAAIRAELRGFSGPRERVYCARASPNTAERAANRDRCERS